MASRWMIGVKGRQRAFRRRQGNISMTMREMKFYRQKINETPEAHIDRMRSEAAMEQAFPTEWWRVLARLIQGLGDDVEAVGDVWKMIKRLSKEGRTIAEIEQSVLRYKRLMGK